MFQGDDPYFNKLIRILATRCMSQVFSIYQSRKLDEFSVYEKLYLHLFMWLICNSGSLFL